MTERILYLDDSGQKEYPPDGAPFDHGVSRYFVFGGFYSAMREAGRLVDGLKAAKVRSFGTTSVEVKSNWLRMPLERERRYLHPFGLNDDQLQSFVDDFYSCVLDADISLLACVVDKLHMTEEYGKARWYPPAAAYECLIQRMQNELGPSGLKFRVVIDDMSGKTPAENDYKENLKRHHAQLQRSGCNFVPMKVDALVGNPKFVNSRDSNLVQVADLIAYNVFRQFREHGEDWEDKGLEQLPSYDWFRRIAPKFRRGANNRIQGYGVIKFPLRVRVPWTQTLTHR